MESARSLSPELFSSAAGLLAQAFYTNPAHVYICRDPSTRLAQLEWVLGRNLRLAVQTDLESSFCLAHDTVVDAMGFWTRPHAAAIGLLPKIRAGILAAPLQLGIRGFRRLLEVSNEIDRLRDETLGDQEFRYLNSLVVREHLRGTGVGTDLLREQLRIVTRLDPEAAIGLSTQRNENVRFYRRLGFEVASEQMVGRDTEPFRNWIMVYRGKGDLFVQS